MSEANLGFYCKELLDEAKKFEEGTDPEMEVNILAGDLGAEEVSNLVFYLGMQAIGAMAIRAGEPSSRGVSPDHRIILRKDFVIRINT